MSGVIDWSERTEIHTVKKPFAGSTLLHEINGLTIQSLFRKNAEDFKDRDHLGFRSYDTATKRWVYFIYFSLYCLFFRAHLSI
jgi:hypothetical protein